MVSVCRWEAKSVLCASSRQAVAAAHLDVHPCRFKEKSKGAGEKEKVTRRRRSVRGATTRRALLFEGKVHGMRRGVM